MQKIIHIKEDSKSFMTYDLKDYVERLPSDVFSDEERYEHFTVFSVEQDTDVSNPDNIINLAKEYTAKWQDNVETLAKYADVVPEIKSAKYYKSRVRFSSNIRVITKNVTVKTYEFMNIISFISKLITGKLGIKFSAIKHDVVMQFNREEV